MDKPHASGVLVCADGDGQGRFVIKVDLGDGQQIEYPEHVDFVTALHYITIATQEMKLDPTQVLISLRAIKEAAAVDLAAKKAMSAFGGRMA